MPDISAAFSFNLKNGAHARFQKYIPENGDIQLMFRSLIRLSNGSLSWSYDLFCHFKFDSCSSPSIFLQDGKSCDSTADIDILLNFTYVGL
jgi:hypothetical protein